MTFEERLERASTICREAGALGMQFFERLDELVIEAKGHQDFVSRADRDVELLMRKRLTEAFPEDGIVGEEHHPKEGTSGFTWVIDPIDGTANFVSGLPAWCVVLAGVRDGETVIGVIFDPCHDHLYAAALGGGATMNGKRIEVSARALDEATIGIGYSNRVEAQGVVRLVQALGAEGAMFYRNASGALSLAHVAAGRFAGFIEEHMNAWDCIAGQLLVREAGGGTETQNADDMIRDGGRVVVGNAKVFGRLLEIADRVFAPPG